MEGHMTADFGPNIYTRMSTKNLFSKNLHKTQFLKNAVWLSEYLGPSHNAMGYSHLDFHIRSDFKLMHKKTKNNA